MRLQKIILLIAFIGLSTCNRVYVHPFNLLTYNKSECEKIQSEDQSTENMFFPSVIESEKNADKESFELQTNLEAGHLGPAENYIMPIISGLSFRAVAGWWKLHKTDSILIPYIDFYRTMASFYLGASGNTSNSLQTFLGLDDPSGSINCTSKVNGLRLISKLNKIDKTFFSKNSNTTTRRTVCIFISSDVLLSEKFVNGLTLTAENLYVKNIDFKDSAQAVKSVNEFLDAKLPANSKSAITSIDVTSNFMYISHVKFKGKVAKSFLHPNHKPFWIEPNKMVLVPMISVSGIFQFTEDSATNQLIIKIMLSNNDFLLFIQPINGNNLENIEASMKWDTYKTYVLAKRYINLSLPKLTIHNSHNIQDLFHSLNVSGLLGKNADFSKISKSKIRVEKVINMVDFELEESEDTTGDSNASETKEEPMEITYNKPFLVAGFEGTTKSLLIMGKVVCQNSLIANIF